MEQEEKRKEFVVKDKRSFDQTGDLRQSEEPERKDPPREEPTAFDRSPSDATKTADQDEEGAEFLSEVNFYNFILSLSTSVIYHFGDIPDPETKTTQRNLAAAKHTIDLLAMLKEKTAGNLENHEKNLLEGILFELKMRYVRETTAK